MRNVFAIQPTDTLGIKNMGNLATHTVEQKRMQPVTAVGSTAAKRGHIPVDHTTVTNLYILISKL